MNAVISLTLINTMSLYSPDFYQGYILPEKFGVDKRKNHFSSLIVSGQMERREAIDLLDCPTYPDEMELIRDKRMFLKKDALAAR